MPDSHLLRFLVFFISCQFFFNAGLRLPLDDIFSTFSKNLRKIGPMVGFPLVICSVFAQM